MAVSIKGMTMRGLQIRGREFLTPNQIAGCVVWHQWLTGVATVSGLVTQWDDQSGNARHMTQGTVGRRPAYNSTTGLIQPSSDYLRADFAGNQNFPEFTFVVEVPVGGPVSPVFCRKQNATIDTDALTLQVNSSRQMQKSQAITGGRTIQTAIPGGLPAGKTILTFTNENFRVNGIVPPYAIKAISSWVGTSSSYHYLFAVTAISGGVEAAPGVFGNVGVYEWCWHSNVLSAINRSKLITYFASKHGLDI